MKQTSLTDLSNSPELFFHLIQLNQLTWRKFYRYCQQFVEFPHSYLLHENTQRLKAQLPCHSSWSDKLSLGLNIFHDLKHVKFQALSIKKVLQLNYIDQCNLSFVTHIYTCTHINRYCTKYAKNIYQVSGLKIVRFVLDIGPMSRISCDQLDAVNMLSVSDRTS